MLTGVSSGTILSDDDIMLLKRWINPTYLNPKSWNKIFETFEGDGSVQLHGFLKADVADKVLAAAVAQDNKDGLGRGRLPDYHAGEGVAGDNLVLIILLHSWLYIFQLILLIVPYLPDRASASWLLCNVSYLCPQCSLFLLMCLSSGWCPVGPPHKQRYLRYTAPPSSTSAAATPSAPDAATPAVAAAEATSCTGSGSSSSMGDQLAAIKHQLFESAAFGRLLKQLTSITMLGHAGEVRRMRPGD